MRVIHSMPDIDKEASGPSYSVVRLCEALNGLGHDSCVALVGEDGVRPYIKSFSKGIGPARLGNSPAMRNWLKEQVATDAVDIVHNHSLWMMPNVYPGWATKGTPVPYVVSPRGTLSAWALASGSRVKRLFWPLVQKPSMLHVACFHATAESEYEDIRRMGFKQPVAIVPNGIDLPDVGSRSYSPVRTLLFLGRLHPVKGVDSLLRVWSALQDEFPDWCLKIVGPTDNDSARDLISLSKRLSLQRVQFSGPLYGDEKYLAYRAADLYVLPSHSENFAMTVAEALSSGTPVVVSQGAPWSGVESHGVGWWPAIGDEPLLAALRPAMARQRSSLSAMGDSGRLWMQRDFSWLGVAEKIKSTYSWLLKRGDRPSCVILD